MDISELKVGDIVVAGREPKRQFFYIHKMDDNELDSKIEKISVR